MLKITLLGNEYEVPEGITVSDAFEYAGIKSFHGKGCKSGFCGACAVLYRTPGDSMVKACLACQTKVQEGMCIATIPGLKTENSVYAHVKDGTLLSLYPEINSCIGCGTCTRLCPKGIDAKKLVEYAREGRNDLVAKEAVSCVMCGICAEKCPRGIKPYSVGMYAGRIEGSKKQMKKHSIKGALCELADLSDEELELLYSESKGEKNVSR